MNIALNVSSEGERVDAEAIAQSGLTLPLHPATSPRPPLSSRSLGDPPTSGDDPGASFTRSLRAGSSTSLKIAIVVGGVLLVLLVFGILTAVKMAGQSMGVLPTASSEPSYSAVAASPAAPEHAPPAVLGPSTAVTVTLDAGRAPP